MSVARKGCDSQYLVLIVGPKFLAFDHTPLALKDIYKSHPPIASLRPQAVKINILPRWWQTLFFQLMSYLLAGIIPIVLIIGLILFTGIGAAILDAL